MTIPGKPQRVGHYLQVSTLDQEAQNQFLQLQRSATSTDGGFTELTSISSRVARVSANALNLPNSLRTWLSDVLILCFSGV